MRIIKKGEPPKEKMKKHRHNNGAAEHGARGQGVCNISARPGGHGDGVGPWSIRTHDIVHCARTGQQPKALRGGAGRVWGYKRAGASGFTSGVQQSVLLHVPCSHARSSRTPQSISP